MDVNNVIGYVSLYNINKQMMLMQHLHLVTTLEDENQIVELKVGG
jgi:hypothetical protein